MHRLVSALRTLGDELEDLTGAEERVRRHPLLACAVAAGLGVALGPRLLPVLWRALGAAGVAGLATAKRTTVLHALMPVALRERLFGGDRKLSL